jgi:hypothetical protein
MLFDDAAAIGVATGNWTVETRPMFAPPVVDNIFPAAFSRCRGRARPGTLVQSKTSHRHTALTLHRRLSGASSADKRAGCSKYAALQFCGADMHGCGGSSAALHHRNPWRCANSSASACGQQGYGCQLSLIRKFLFRSSCKLS